MNKIEILNDFLILISERKEDLRRIRQQKAVVENIIKEKGKYKTIHRSIENTGGVVFLGGRKSNPFDEIIKEYPDYNEEAYLAVQEMIDETIGILEFESPLSEDKHIKISVKTDNKKVFIVHGHDKELKQEVARVVEKLKLDAVILHEQANGGNTIIEKLEKHTNNVGYGIVLYTPCDMGGERPEFLQPRARQNVVFEHGLLVGKLGRDRVMTLVKGDVDTPGDISGVVYTSAVDGWAFKLVGELKKLGYDVSADDLF